MSPRLFVFSLPFVLPLAGLAAWFLIDPTAVEDLLSGRTLILAALIALSPLGATASQMAGRRYPWSLRNLAVGCLLNAFRVTFLLEAQLVAIPILFLVGPVWLFALFLTIADLVAWALPGVDAVVLPGLCRSIGSGCLPVVAAYHALSALLAVLVYRHARRLLRWAAAWYEAGCGFWTSGLR